VAPLGLLEPFRAALRRGNWKLVLQATLPSRVELFDLATDPSEERNVADQNPRIVADLRERMEVLAREAVPPLVLKEAFGAMRHVLFGSVALPADVTELARVP
jgi:arylsulfatase A-like enzyme